MKKLLSLFMALVISLTFVPTMASAKSKAVLNKKTTTIRVGKKVQLKVLGIKAKVKWSTSNKAIATVSKKGVVTAKKTGTVKITAQVYKKKLVCKVKVKPIENYLNRMLYSEFKTESNCNYLGAYGENSVELYFNACNEYYDANVISKGDTSVSVSYNLNKKYKTFLCDLWVHSNVSDPFDFKIYGDDKLLYSMTLTGATGTLPFKIDTRNIDNFKIELHSAIITDHWDSEHGIILENARFIYK